MRIGRLQPAGIGARFMLERPRALMPAFPSAGALAGAGMFSIAPDWSREEGEGTGEGTGEGEGTGAAEAEQDQGWTIPTPGEALPPPQDVEAPIPTESGPGFVPPPIDVAPIRDEDEPPPQPVDVNPNVPGVQTPPWLPDIGNIGDILTVTHPLTGLPVSINEIGDILGGGGQFPGDVLPGFGGGVVDMNTGVWSGSPTLPPGTSQNPVSSPYEPPGTPPVPLDTAVYQPAGTPPPSSQEAAGAAYLRESFADFANEIQRNTMGDLRDWGGPITQWWSGVGNPNWTTAADFEGFRDQLQD